MALYERTGNLLILGTAKSRRQNLLLSSKPNLKTYAIIQP